MKSRDIYLNKLIQFKDKPLIKVITGIRRCGKSTLLDLFEEVSKPYVIVTFLSILDMSKNKEIIITQDNNFGQIYIDGSN